MIPRSSPQINYSNSFPEPISYLSPIPTSFCAFWNFIIKFEVSLIFSISSLVLTFNFSIKQKPKISFSPQGSYMYAFQMASLKHLHHCAIYYFGNIFAGIFGDLQ